MTPLTITSPDGRTRLHFAIEDSVRKFSADRGCAFYWVERDGVARLDKSRLGLEPEGAPPLAASFQLLEHQVADHRGSWSPCYGQQSSYRDDYAELRVTLGEQLPPMRTLVIELRVYDQGVAFRYRLGSACVSHDDDTCAISGEASEFRFGEAARGYQQRWPEDEYRLTTLHQLAKPTESPLLVELPAGGFAAVMEAGTDHFSRMRVLPDQWQKDVLRVALDGTSRLKAGDATPWRVVGLADRAVDLIGLESLVLNLSAPCAIEQTDWIKPGKAIREVTLSTRGGRACVDFAAANGLQYILYDAGWYGFEYDDNADPRQVAPDPARTRNVPDYAGLDLTDVLAYARSKGVGVFLYVNRRAAERYWKQIIPLYAAWGVVGIKFGFVNVGGQGCTRLIHDMIRLCAKHRLLVDLHDFYRPVGFSRTYPNLLTQEGTRGNEHFPTATHNVTLPFTRFITGPADYTICYRHSGLKTRSAHQLALAIVYYSPLQLIYWYSQPQDYAQVSDIALFQHVPSVWDETIALAGEVGHHVAIARRSGTRWFIGAMAGDEPVSLTLALGFLKGRAYRATFYRDATTHKSEDRTSVVIESRIVSSEQTIEVSMLSAGGVAIRLEPVEAR